MNFSRSPASDLHVILHAPSGPDSVAFLLRDGMEVNNGEPAMFQTNPPEFDSARDDSRANGQVSSESTRLNGGANEKQSKPQPEFATLEAFACWLDMELEGLESLHEGFETISSVRGFYGR